MSKGKIIKKEHKKDWLLSLTIEIPKEEFNKKVDYLAKKYSKIVQIPGFRKGKAPVSVIMKKYGDSIEQEAFDELMEKTYKSALIEEKIIPVATGNIKDLNKDALLYTAEIEIIPKIEVERYKGIDIEYVPVKYDDNTLDVEIDNLRKRNGEFVPVERESSYGDLMIIDLKAYDENKKPVKELTMENYGITLGDGYVFHDVEEALIGMKAGQETNIQSVVPDYYKKQELVGKKIYFNVKVKELKTILLPNLDDE
ncbi:trigger factor, partial [candidate division WOR-3 bacterium]|nr:trigger factor [candidate division WOR-3 bacterium]